MDGCLYIAPTLNVARQAAADNMLCATYGGMIIDLDTCETYGLTG